MTDVSLAAAFLAGLVSFLSPCVLPLVPGYISMLSGIGMEQLRQGQQPKGSLFSSALSFVFGFSVVFISFGAAASAVGSFLRGNRNTLAPVSDELIILVRLHAVHRANSGHGAGAGGCERYDCARRVAAGGLFGWTGSSLSVDGAGYRTIFKILPALPKVSARRRTIQRRAAVICRRVGVS